MFTYLKTVLVRQGSKVQNIFQCYFLRLTPQQKTTCSQRNYGALVSEQCPSFPLSFTNWGSQNVASGEDCAVPLTGCSPFNSPSTNTFGVFLRTIQTAYLFNVIISCHTALLINILCCKYIIILFKYLHSMYSFTYSRNNKKLYCAFLYLWIVCFYLFSLSR